MVKHEFIFKFKEYCRQRFSSETGTAVSYTNAIKYFLEFMSATEITGDLILEIRSLEPDIRDSGSILYGELENFFTSTGRGSYLKKGFLKAALPILFEFSNTLLWVDISDTILLSEVRDNQVVANFSTERLRHQLPTAEYIAHNYSVRRISGTSNESVMKVRSGRKAEKYFISFLINLGFSKNLDFLDVANNKNYGYDIRFFDVGLEIKNVKSGTFFLTDNEIARLENTETHLILVDIDNGIWVLKNNSLWLKNVIRNIKNLRAYCYAQFSNLDPCDIKIVLTEDVKNYAIDISTATKMQTTEMLTGGH